MMKLSTLISSSILVLGLIVNGAYSWGYDGAKGVAHWGEEYKKCEGLKQSPINIDTSKVVVNHDLAFQIDGLDMQHKSHLKNNGHSVQLELLDSPKPTLTGSVVNNKVYKFAQLHFHWGKTSATGSEHSVNSHFYPEEMHMVFYNEKYDDFNAASKYDDGLVVVGTFFKNATFNYNFQPLLYAVNQAKKFDSDVQLPRPITFRQLLPKNIEKFYTYSGSLTTPPCDESVTWIVLAETISFSEKQLDTFRHEKTNHVSEVTGTNQLVNNYRNQAPLGDRVVQASFDL